MIRRILKTKCLLSLILLRGVKIINNVIETTLRMIQKAVAGSR
jgi:hypothetical protein